jgi:CheY-like chemotaxis protein
MQSSKPAKPLRILFIDDDDINNYVLEDTFANLAEVQAEFITDGYTAYEMLTKQATESPKELPDVVFLDIKMPGIDGFEVLDLLERDKHLNDKATEIFILSSTVDQRDEDKAQTYSLVRELVPKPLTLDKFWATMERYGILSRPE